MLRTFAIAMGIAALAGAAPARPLRLSDPQLDRVTAGSANLSPLVLATLTLSPTVNVPAPMNISVVVPPVVMATLNLSSLKPLTARDIKGIVHLSRR